MSRPVGSWHSTRETRKIVSKHAKKAENDYDDANKPDTHDGQGLQNPYATSKPLKNRRTEEDDEEVDGPGQRTAVTVNAPYLHEWHKALLDGDVGSVRRLISRGFDIESPILEGLLPLCHAATLSVAVTSCLLAAGATVDGKVGSSGTPLQNAIALNREKIEVARLLLDYGADVNAPSGAHGTALEAALDQAEHSLVYMLIARGADINQLNAKHQARAILAAIEENDVLTTSRLLDAGVDPNVDLDGHPKPLLASIHQGNKYRADSSQSGWGSVKFVVISNGLAYYALSMFALTSGSQGDHERVNLEIIRTLLEHGASIDLEVVLAAIDDEYEGAVLLLLEYGADASQVFANWHRRHYYTELPVLKRWEFATQGYSYDTLEDAEEAFCGAREDRLFTMTWDWEVPAVIEMARYCGVAAFDIADWLLAENVVFVTDLEHSHPTAINCRDLLFDQFGFAVSTFVVDVLRAVAAKKLGDNDDDYDLLSELHIRDFRWIHRVESMTFSYRTITMTFRALNPYTLGNPYCRAIDRLSRTIHMPAPDGSMVLSRAVYKLDRCQVPPDYGMEKSHRQSETSRTRYRIEAFMHIKNSPLPAHEHDCWRLLFTGCVVSVFDAAPSGRLLGRPSRQDVGKGLKLPFDLMISLAAVECQLIINGGVVFVGYQTVLFPTAISENDAQFHAIVSDGGQINPYTLDFPNRLLIQDASQFTGMQCFLGWCEAAQINLGTRQLPADVRYSGGQDQERYLVLEGQSTQLQIGLQSPVSFLVGLQTNFKFISSRRQFTPADCYAKLLEDTAEELAIVYDAGQRRCWLLPKLSLLLHMSHAYARRRALPCFRVPHVDPHADAREIIGLLKSSGECPIHEDPAEPFLFRQLLLGLNINLLATVSAVQQSSGKKLYGFEFLDVVTSPGRGSCMKKLELDAAGKAWLDIVNVVDAVVVCSDLGEAITPAEGSGRESPSCNAVPKNRDYLAATLPCLTRLIERKGGRLTPQDGFQGFKISEDSYWLLCGNPFEPCIHGTSGSSSCWKRYDIIQRLEPAKLFKLLPLPRRTPSAAPVSDIPLSGAVVFGKRVA
ncbi:hypothetical protein AYL99_01480 [Fonsecaea erecta]|uniref:Uncharacterized protein n=1 Tax=Fonsecaea erecta TaxID=1367422 RepID=A0A179A081_9EURO|nr:hypothetical protein AYL99_01480 [Fonsecaea erecta]OAP65508.1 hypothetical protein AYL99_01480 [Fonsecaea erecta]